MIQKRSRFVAILSSLGASIAGSCGGACGVACLAGGCCGGTVLFGLIGLSGSTLSFFEKLTPVFLVLTIASLSYGFYKAYAPKKSTCCAPAETESTTSCCEKKTRTPFLQSKAFLWGTTILCALMWLYPVVLGSHNSPPVRKSGTSVMDTTIESATSSGGCCPADTTCETSCE